LADQQEIVEEKKLEAIGGTLQLASDPPEFALFFEHPSRVQQLLSCVKE
jgi:hypothetical protein